MTADPTAEAEAFYSPFGYADVGGYSGYNGYNGYYSSPHHYAGYRGYNYPHLGYQNYPGQYYVSPYTASPAPSLYHPHAPVAPYTAGTPHIAAAPPLASGAPHLAAAPSPAAHIASLAAAPAAPHSIAAVADVPHPHHDVHGDVPPPPPAPAGVAYPAVTTSQYHAQDEEGNYSFGYVNPNGARTEMGNPYTGVTG